MDYFSENVNRAISPVESNFGDDSFDLFARHRVRESRERGHEYNEYDRAYRPHAFHENSYNSPTRDNSGYYDYDMGRHVFNSLSQPRSRERTHVSTNIPLSNYRSISEFTERPKIMPDTYSGETPWEAYLTRFKIIADINGWDETQCGHFLAASLIKSAGHILTRLPSHNQRNYRALVDALTNRFSLDSHVKRFKVELSSLAKRNTESYAEYADRIVTLVNGAYPNADVVTQDEIALEKFINSLPDVNMIKELRKAVTLSDAVAEAVEIDLCEKSIKQISQNRRPFRAAHVKESDSQTHVLETIKKQLDEMKLENSELRKIVTSLNSDKNRGMSQTVRRNDMCYRFAKIDVVEFVVQ